MSGVVIPYHFNKPQHDNGAPFSLNTVFEKWVSIQVNIAIPIIEAQARTIICFHSFLFFTSLKKGVNGSFATANDDEKRLKLNLWTPQFKFLIRIFNNNIIN